MAVRTSYTDDTRRGRSRPAAGAAAI